MLLLYSSLSTIGDSHNRFLASIFSGLACWLLNVDVLGIGILGLLLFSPLIESDPDLLRGESTLFRRVTIFLPSLKALEHLITS
jgi:hypothetical protein